MKKLRIALGITSFLATPLSAQDSVRGTPGPAELLPRCMPSVEDTATGNCLEASSVPEVGKLFPLSYETLWMDELGNAVLQGSLDVRESLHVLGNASARTIFGDSVIADRVGVGVASIPAADIHVRSVNDASVLLEADVHNLDEFAQPRITFSQDGGAIQSRIGFFGGSNNFSITNDSDTDQLFQLPGGFADWEFWKGQGLAADRKAYVNQDGNMAIDGNYSSGGADLAEYYPIEGSVEPGDVVAFTGEDLVIGRADARQRGSLAGIVSSDPGVVLGLTYTDEHDLGENPEDLCAGDRLAAIRHEIEVNRRAPLALSGRVPCKVTDANGPIRVGDLLTVSHVPGRAMKATESGAVLGTALEDWSSGEGSILVLANLGHFSSTTDLERRVAELEAQVRALLKTR